MSNYTVRDPQSLNDFEFICINEQFQPQDINLAIAILERTFGSDLSAQINFLQSVAMTQANRIACACENPTIILNVATDIVVAWNEFCSRTNQKLAEAESATKN